MLLNYANLLFLKTIVLKLLLFIFNTFNDAFEIIQHQMIGEWLVNNELQSLWKLRWAYAHSY
jgi:hypothetical protein